jgi:hypothetical protein
MNAAAHERGGALFERWWRAPARNQREQYF